MSVLSHGFRQLVAITIIALVLCLVPAGPAHEPGGRRAGETAAGRNRLRRSLDRPARRGDPKVARMAGERKRCRWPFPTFGVLQAYCFSIAFHHLAALPRREGGPFEAYSLCN